jgi:Ceramidase
MLVLVGAWFLLPVIPQPQSYHAFANTRAWLGIPNAADTLSNLPFVFVGILGLRYLRRSALASSSATIRGLFFTFLGFLLTGIGSAWYHLSPDDSRLLWDRLPMTIAFAGVAGAIFALRVSERSGDVLLALMLITGPASLVYWQVTGDLSMYGVVQFGTLALLLGVLLAAKNPDDPFPWFLLFGWYVLAKIFETADVLVWRATDGLVSGHTLKHLAAAAGGWALTRAVSQLRERNQGCVAGVKR